jgi:hypothetical protein
MEIATKGRVQVERPVADPSPDLLTLTSVQ